MMLLGQDAGVGDDAIRVENEELVKLITSQKQHKNRMKKYLLLSIMVLSDIMTKHCYKNF